MRSQSPSGWLIFGLLFFALFCGTAIVRKSDNQLAAQEIKQPEIKAEAETFQEVIPNFANLTLVRAGVYDSGTGMAVITTGEKGDASKALVQLIGRRQCWVDKFPERAKRIRNEPLAHRTIIQDEGTTAACGKVLPWAFIITYDKED